MTSALALVHSRFSTNTFPSWDRAHPNRYIAHNGEINTLRGNVNWMHAPAGEFRLRPVRQDIKKLILPSSTPTTATRRMFDNVVELAHAGGPRIAARDDDDDPRAVGKSREHGRRARKAFYEYHSCLMEPWDGPASVAFTDGKMIGACLDRNGLRPSRLRHQGRHGHHGVGSRCAAGFRAGTRRDVKGRLQPGRMFLVDTERAASSRMKRSRRNTLPPRRTRRLDQHHVLLEDACPTPRSLRGSGHRKVLQRQQAFGYTFEDLRF
jgi:hypothetical protein